jgi:hypothetical protein
MVSPIDIAEIGLEKNENIFPKERTSDCRKYCSTIPPRMNPSIKGAVGIPNLFIIYPIKPNITKTQTSKSEFLTLKVPTIAKHKIMLTKIGFGHETTLAKYLAPNKPNTKNKIFDNKRIINMEETISGFCSNNIGPGASPWSINAPINMAVTTSPGIPKVNIGIIAPPVAALLALSGPIIPRSSPLPNVSGCFEMRFSNP